ncbi:NUDIX hydrolase [Streptomyces litchfieldiae]|uniref:NUDIX domain-containing protein n=1 Tax=Streptomyces litchfieldiae TaxID=3075543 RepID=A0ABU2MT44_9ACTN|nr:NUDIX domain-containing protein [Streptomyces sp. DSM 44938]MDT0344812.1 NUDIX domain-containing protein [Streptomyces sp. DSM 44938]
MRRRPARRTARVLLLDGAGRLLLFRMTDATPLWMTPGGGIRKHEPPREAAARELWEETGLRVTPDELGPYVAFTEGEADLGWKSGWFEDHYFLHRTAAHEVDTSGMEDRERGNTVGHRWWSVAELAATTDAVIPRGLTPLLTDILAGRTPTEPVRLPWHHAQN